MFHDVLAYTSMTADSSIQVGMGRDHTIFALVPGYVRFWKEPGSRKDRKYIGLVLNRGEKLPRDEAALGRSRFCGLVNLTEIAKQQAETS